jgi:hypothetical protein
MAKSRKQLLAALFESLAADLANVEGTSTADHVKCPLCLNVFGRDSLENRAVTLEHPIPRGVGGRFCTLSCQLCNNKHGSRLDSHVVNAARWVDAGEGHYAMKTKVTVGDASLQARLTWTPDRGLPNTIRVIGKASDPRQVEAVRGYLDAGTRELQLMISADYIPNRLHLGLLRAAYLFAFDQHGYSYALAPSLTFVRRQITEADAPSAYLDQIVGRIRTPEPAPPKECVEIDLKPALSRSAYLFLLQVRLNVITTYAVFLPHAGPEASGQPEELASAARDLSGKQFTVRYTRPTSENSPC